MPKAETRSKTPPLRMAGVEFYFDDLARAKDFYSKALGLSVKNEGAGHFVQFDAGSGFVCLERKGSENYPSQDKAVLFFEVSDLEAAVESLGRDRIVRYEAQGGAGRSPWAVLYDTEGHNILLLQAPKRHKKQRP
jgi:predicted enzyme related to lactoylglutathione lyase